MKKFLPIFLVVVLLAGCANLPDVSRFFTTPTAPPPADTDTPQPTVTLIPTRDLFATSTGTPVTFTPTETPLVPEVTPTLTTPTMIPLPTFSEEFINDMSKITFFEDTFGFQAILYSAPILYWGAGACTTRSIKFTAFVDDPDRTDRVFLFVRLRDKQNTLNLGEWSAGAEMIKIENGSFNYNIETHNLRRYYSYKSAWIEYQLVSVNENLEVIGRTQIYDHNVSLAKCGL
ncbi:MAG: hypothetical protein C3F07_17715 [Anaerolineales bacterium]|nr:MAG: hypothetical protein C3F07_17715 [Anaerolineales bacterium]